MADTHEEQLLNELLRTIERDDARLDAAHLESRVVASAFDRGPQLSAGTAGVPHWAAAAAVAAAVLATSLLWINQDAVPHGPKPAVEATQEIVSDTPAAVVPKRSDSATVVRQAPSPVMQPVVDRSATQTYVIESPIAQSPSTQSPDEFLPLMPMTEQELTGSFQIVRVQMPRASLGPLRSPLEHPNELVEADVLLGEDGLARAIRVSASGSDYQWRSR